MRYRWILISAIFAVFMLAFGPAMAQDIRVQNYKNTISGLVSRWATAEIALAGKLSPILDELAQKKAISNPSDADKARIADLQRQRDDIAKQMENESNNLRLELLIVEVQPGAPERDLIVLPDWLKQVIKEKGIPTGKGVTIVPDASFDVKALKLKSFSVGLRFNWM